MKPGELWEPVRVAWLWTPPFWEMGEPAPSRHPPPQPQTNLVLSNGLSSASGQSLAREGPGQDESSDPQGGGSELEPAVCDSGPRKEELVGDVEVAGGWRVSGIGQDQHRHGDSNDREDRFSRGP